MIISNRITLLATSVAAVFALSACEPASEVTPSKEAMQPSIAAPKNETTQDTDPHAGHNMAEGKVPADAAKMTEMQKDYNKSMSKMNDEMMVGMGYNDPDAAFAKSMLGHHLGAVDMAKVELKYGTDKAMRKLAQEIIDAQQAEISTMKKWLASKPDSPEPKPDTPAMQKAYADGMDAMHEDMMKGIADPEPDMAFARGMLPHHVGAVDMAKVQLEYGKNEEMRKLAQEIIDAQQPEIKLMQDWIATH